MLPVQRGNLAERIRPVVEAAPIFQLHSRISLINETKASVEDRLAVQGVRNTYSGLQKSPRRIEQGLSGILRRIDQGLPAVHASGHPGRLWETAGLRHYPSHLIPAPVGVGSEYVLGVNIKNRCITIPMPASTLVVVTQPELHRQLGVDFPVIHHKRRLALVVWGDQEVPPLIEAGRAKHDFGKRMPR